MAIFAVIAIFLLYRRHLFGGAREKQMLSRWVIVILIVGGLLCLAFLPEIWFVLPAFDAVGLDVVTILMLLELRRYVDGVLYPLGGPSALKATARRALILSFDMPRLVRYTVTGAFVSSWLLIGTSAALHCLRIRGA